MLGALIGLFGGGKKTISISTPSLFGGAYGPGTGTTDYVTVSQTNLTNPISYSWTRVSGSTAIYASALNQPTIRFYGYVNGAAISAVWKCTVTDGAGFSQDTDPVTITFEDYFV